MEQHKEIIFYSCKSYKSGKYLFSRYKVSEFVCMLVVFVLIMLVLMSNANLFRQLFLPCAILMGLVIFITFPIRRYHAMYMLFGYMFRFMRSKKVFIWKGVQYVFEKENQ